MLRFLRVTSTLFLLWFGVVMLAVFVGQQRAYPAIVYVAKSLPHDEVRLVDLNIGFVQTIAQADAIGVLDVSPSGDILVTTHAQMGSILNRVAGVNVPLVDVVHGIDDNPVWSPDAKRIAYRRYYYQGGLYIYTVGRWPPRPLRLNDATINATSITWSPDGDVLAYARWSEVTNQESPLGASHGSRI